MYRLKVTASGKSLMVDNHDININITTNVNEDDFENILGKIIFAVECAGIQINTHEIFTSVVANNYSVSDDYTEIYNLEKSDTVMKIMLKNFVN